MILDKKENIAIFTDTYLPNANGVSYSIKRQTEALKEKGHRVTIIGPDYLDVDIKIKSLVLLKTKDKNYSFSIPIELTTFLSSKRKVDVVWIHTPFSIGILAVKFANKYKLPIVFTHHTNFNHYFCYLPFFNNPVGRYALTHLYNMFLKRIDRIIVPSRTSMHQLIKNNNILTSKIRVIPTPISKDILFSERELKNKLYDFILIGRLSYEKNIFLSMESIQIIIERLPNVKIAIVGDGILKNYVQLNLRKHLGKNVFLLGEIDNYEVIKNIRSSHLLLFPSVSETQGLVLQEAWVNDVPVVAIACELIREYVVEGSNGWYTKNNANEYSQKAIDILSEKKQDKNRFDFDCKINLEKFMPSTWYRSFNKKILKEVTL